MGNVGMKKILVVCSGIWEPAVSVSGTKTIYKLIKMLAKYENVELHVLTDFASWTDKNYKHWFLENEREYRIKFYYIKANYLEKIPVLNLIITRFSFFFKILILQYKYKFQIIHDFISSTTLLYFSFFYKRILKLKVVYSIVTFSRYFYRYNNLFNNIRNIDYILCGSKYMYKILLNVKSKNIIEKIKYIPIGLDLKDFNKSYAKKNNNKGIDLPFNKKSVLYIGPLEKQKGIFIFAKAARRILLERNDIFFIIASYGKSGKNENYYKNKEIVSNIIGSNFCILEGKLNIQELLLKCNVFVLPLENMHGTLLQPLTLLEAMACGCKCIVSRLSGLEEIIEDGKEGIFFDSKKIEDLKRKVIKSIDNSNYLLLGEKAKEKIYRSYNISKSSKRIYKLYKELGG